MTVDELEQILEAGKETQNIDFKESCPWNESTFIKDILAMANTQDGGVIVIGMEESGQSFLRKGVQPEHKTTYVVDTIKDKVGKYADPYVFIDIHFPEDSGGKMYVVLKIYPFDRVPVICKKDGHDVKQGEIYHRGFNRRAQSIRVSSYFDMREMLERATVKMMQHYQRLDLSTTKTVEDKFAQERGGL